MANNPYAAGTKVYNGGSSAATQGAVDPMGYIDRSLNQNPAYSPGVAAGAIQTLQANSPTQPTPTSQQAPTPTPTPSPTQSNTTGQITWKMPVDYDLQLQGIQQNAAYQDLLLQITAAKNQATMDRTVGLRDLGQAEEQSQLRDINNASYRGMARSSGYVTQVDKTAQQFNNARTDLESRFLNALNNANAKQVSGQQQLDDVMTSIYAEAARRLAEKITNGDSVIDPLPNPNDKPGTPVGSGGQGPVKAPKPPAGSSGPNAPTVPRAPKPGAPSVPKTPTKSTTTKTTSTKTTSFRAARGDSLQSIAKKYGITVAQLTKLNPQLKRANGQYVVYANSKINVPSR